MVTMRVQIFAAASLAAAMAFTPAAPLRAQQGIMAGDPVKGAALLADARKALGGEDKLRAVKTLQVKGSFRRTAGNNQLEGDLEILVEAPDKMKRTEDMSAPGGGPAVIATQALNGTEVWDENTGGGARGGFGGFAGGGGGGRGGFGGGGDFGGRGGGGGGGRGGAVQGGPDGQPAAGAPGAAAAGARGNVDPERLRQAQLRQRQADLSRLMFVWLLTTDAPVTWIGTAESPDGTADVVELRPADGTPSTRLFLDAATHMPLMITWPGAAPQGAGRRGGGARRGGADQPGGAQPGGDPAAAPPPPAPAPPQQATLRMTLADYKTVGGIKLPHTITRGVNGQTNEEWAISSYKVNQTFRSNTFEQKK